MWEVPATESLGRIVFDATCTNLTGNFNLYGGILEVNHNLTTTGNLDTQGVATIKVAIGKTASFD